MRLLGLNDANTEVSSSLIPGSIIKMLLIVLITFVYSSDPIKYVVGGDITFESPNIGEQYSIIEYAANYKPITLDFEMMSNVKYYLISDQVITEENTACPPESLYCSYGDSKRVKEQISVCIDKVFLHIYSKSGDKSAVARIKTDYLHDIPCNDINRNPTNFCQLLSTEECLEGCSTGCGLLKCQDHKSLNTFDVFSLCMPDSTPKAEQERRCFMHAEVNKANWKVCGDNENNGNWMVFIVISVLILILLFGGAVVYYQKMYQKHGRPPFKVPGFCPHKLFPRMDEEEAENLRVIQ